MEIPEWEDIEKNRHKRELTPLERFVHENEPAGKTPWRKQLQELIEWVILMATHNPEDMGE